MFVFVETWTLLSFSLFFDINKKFCVFLKLTFFYFINLLFLIIQVKTNQTNQKKTVEYVIRCVILLINVFVKNTIFIIQTTYLCWFCESFRVDEIKKSVFVVSFFFVFFFDYIFHFYIFVYKIINLDNFSVRFFFRIAFCHDSFFPFSSFLFFDNRNKTNLSVEYNQFNERFERSIRCTVCFV